MGFISFIREEILKLKSRFPIPREVMPQIDSSHVESFIAYMESEGVDHEYVTVDPSSLDPTQKEINTDKTDSMDLSSAGGRTLNLKPLIISRDWEILDGHHRWWRAWKYENAPIVWCLKFDCDIKELFQLARGFEGSFTKKIDEDKK